MEHEVASCSEANAHARRSLLRRAKHGIACRERPAGWCPRTTGSSCGTGRGDARRLGGAYGALGPPLGWRSCARARSDCALPNSRPSSRAVSRAAFAVSCPKAEDSCPRGEAVAGSAIGSLISLAAPASDALAGTTSIVTSRSRCCARAALESARTRIPPIAYRVNRLITHLLLAVEPLIFAGPAGYMSDRPALSISIFSRNVLPLSPCDRCATSSPFVVPCAINGSCSRFPPSRKSVCQLSSRRSP